MQGYSFYRDNHFIGIIIHKDIHLTGMFIIQGYSLYNDILYTRVFTNQGYSLHKDILKKNIHYTGIIIIGILILHGYTLLFIIIYRY